MPEPWKKKGTKNNIDSFASLNRKSLFLHGVNFVTQLHGIHT